MRQPSWKHDEEGLMSSVLSVMHSGAEEPVKPLSQVSEHVEKFLAGKKALARALLRWLIGQCRRAVYNREYTKSKFIMAADALKEAYAELANLLVKAGALPDADLIYFLKHEEIGLLIAERKAALVKKALRRRRLLEEQDKMRYKEVNIGRPEPVRRKALNAEDGEALSGTPISRGQTEGIARVVQSQEDARCLREGEIMVAAFTDIGWSPWYCLIKGLVTEVGSALSHGAVVAREYALPVVANINNATRLFCTGDYISLNGNDGTVTLLKKAS